MKCNYKRSLNRTYENIIMNGTTSAKKCGLFDTLNKMGILDNGEYTSMNINSDGSLWIVFAAPNISGVETKNFYDNPLIAHAFPVNNYYAMLLDGPICADMITDPNLYNDNRMTKIKQNKSIEMYLIDTNSDEIEGYKSIMMEDKFYEFIEQNA